MDWLGLLRAIFALTVVVGLILALAWVLKRYAPQLMAQLQAPRGRKRLQVVETLVLDPARRLVLVRLDEEERLILLGEGRELIEPRVRPAASPSPVAVAVAEDTPVRTRPAPSARPENSKTQDANDDLF